MDRTACTEPQCLYKGDLYLFYLINGRPLIKFLLRYKYRILCNKSNTDLDHDVNHTLPSSAEVKNNWRFTSTPPLPLRHGRGNNLCSADAVGGSELSNTNLDFLNNNSALSLFRSLIT